MKMKYLSIVLIFLLVGIIAVSGCTQQGSNNQTNNSTVSNASATTAINGSNLSQSANNGTAVKNSSITKKSGGTNSNSESQYYISPSQALSSAKAYESESSSGYESLTYGAPYLTTKGNYEVYAISLSMNGTYVGCVYIDAYSGAPRLTNYP